MRRRASTPCRHPTCGCNGDASLQSYCSTYCFAADHSDIQPGACSCGHRACVAKRQAIGRKRRGETKIAIGPI